ncbi:chaplin [Nonomuraea turkmeniaca]|uniref:Chaplin n=1 Tax=Nonomuraea turkmeniaca TaxID=103838 RepID=A0A5S4F7A5_9ACTN|nr:chaplin [Nonomuraea turkmeniaca]TMR12316.1 chaplin [Nonomuraea turkmeniaca]
MLKKTLAVAGAVAVVSLAAPAAHANVTSGNGGVLSGNQVHLPIGIPINVCGNAVAVLGSAIAGCKGGAKVIDY